MPSFRLRIFYFVIYIAGLVSGLTFCYFILGREIICSTRYFTPAVELLATGGNWLGQLRSALKTVPVRGDLRSIPRHTRNSSVVFIGGYPRSGTTLMRVLLDAHPTFHCGQETHIIPDLLHLRLRYSRGRSLGRIREAGLDLNRVNETIAESILDIIRSQGNAKRLCSKDPFTLKHIPYLARVFPNSQFILMVRDARAVVHSIRENRIRILNFPETNSSAFQRWNEVLEKMFNDCVSVGPERCKVVHYESVVLKPRLTVRDILHFLKTPWSDRVMDHTAYLGASGGIVLSNLERSTHQVSKPIYNNSLYLWLTSPLDVPSEQLVAWAPMMATLGYIDIGQPPKYASLKMTYS